MSSRGTMTVNGHVMSSEYVAVKEFNNVKVLKGIGGKHSLPDYTKTLNRIYVKEDHAGNFRELRDYDKNGKVFIEIAYHAERTLTGNGHEKVLHYHKYDKDLKHGRAIKLTKTLYEKYHKILEVYGL